MEKLTSGQNKKEKKGKDIQNLDVFVCKVWCSQGVRIVARLDLGEEEE